MKTTLQVAGLALIGMLAMSGEKISEWAIKGTDSKESKLRFKVRDRSPSEVYLEYDHLTQEEALDKIVALNWNSISGNASNPQAISYLKSLGRTQGREALDQVFDQIRHKESPHFPYHERTAIIMTYVFAGWAESEPQLALASFREFTSHKSAVLPSFFLSFSWDGQPIARHFG